MRNFASNCENGVIFCAWAGGFVAFPNGDPVAAEFSASQWLAIRNNGDGNDAAYLFIDGSNQNVMVSNDASNSNIYDFWFRGDVPNPVLGILPSSFDNVYIAGAFPGKSVKDCGIKNSILGGILNTTDPCP